MMSQIYSAVRYRLDNLDRYLIYYGWDVQSKSGKEDTGVDEVDGVVLDENGKMPVFRSVENLAAYAQAHDLAPIDIDTDYVGFCNLDRVIAWMRRKRPAKLDCNLFLTTWNLLADISATVDGHFDPDWERTGMIYDKLFGGSSAGAIMQTGRLYKPVWPGRESRLIREVLSDGLQLFRYLVSQQR